MAAPGAQTNCRNCGAVPQGPFCQACGQATHVHRSLPHLLEEALHGLFHFETKGWRTLPLLVARPGLLTRRYALGERVRYVSPLALFLFCVFVLFFGASVLPSGATPLAASERARAELRQAVTEARTDLAEAEAEAAADVASASAAASASPRAESLRRQATARTAVATLTMALRAAESAASAAALGSRPASPPSSTHSSMSVAASAPAGTGGDEAIVVGPFVIAQPHGEQGGPLRSAFRKALADPAFTLYRMKSSAYKFAVLFVPVSLPFVWLVFCRRRDVGLYDHAVFLLYSLSFMALLFVVVMAFAAADADEAGALLFCAVPLHIGWQLKEAYALGLWSAVWRALTLSVVAGLVLVLYGLFVAWLSVA